MGLLEICGGSLEMGPGSRSGVSNSLERAGPAELACESAVVTLLLRMALSGVMVVSAISGSGVSPGTGVNSSGSTFVQTEMVWFWACSLSTCHLMVLALLWSCLQL